MLEIIGILVIAYLAGRFFWKGIRKESKKDD